MSATLVDKRSSEKRRVLPLPFAVAISLGLLLTACSSDGNLATPTSSPTSEPTVSASPSRLNVIPTVAPPTESPPSLTLSPTPEPTAPPSLRPTRTPDATAEAQRLRQNATKLMEGLLGVDTLRLIPVIGSSGNSAFVPVLLDLLDLSFQPFVGAWTRSALTELLVELEGDTEENRNPHSWSWWVEWLGNHPEIEAPDGYAAWKGRVLSLIDYNMGVFFYDGIKSRIRIEEIVWGGVAKDGIPDLRNSPTLTATEATYLLPTDRVFGVSVNGKHRAYPLRILNPHEMANDVLGGVPIVLAN